MASDRIIPPRAEGSCRPGRAARQRTGAPILLSAACLTWAALWNGYPLVFDDTGTYLSQAIHRYLGWDRPPFYSLFLFPLHLTVTTWPVVAIQSLLAAGLLHLLQRALLPAASAWWLLPMAAFLSLGSSLPWFASQLMPDLFTPLLVLALALLIFVPDRLSRREHWGLAALATFMIAAQQSSLLLAAALLIGLLPVRRWLSNHDPPRLRWLLAPPCLAAAMLAAINLAGFGRLSLSPFGNIFILARVLYDGPGMDILRQDCPDAGWRLCAYLDRFPAESDQFLWRRNSPLVLAGGHKLVSNEANAIIRAAIRAEPARELLAWLGNGLAQLSEFRSGDGLHPCPATVTPWIARDFPPQEYAAYAAARQTNAAILLPSWMQHLHRAVAVAGMAGCLVVLLATIRRPHPAAGFAAAVLLAILANAFIAGGLSTPHHRYGSRIVWLAPAVGVLGGAALLQDRARGMAAGPTPCQG